MVFGFRSHFDGCIWRDFAAGAATPFDDVLVTFS